MNDDNKQDLEHCWEYFKFHGKQRISLFRFYIAIFTFFLASSGFLALRFCEPEIFAELSSILISIVFVIVTVIFHLLDRRNRQLIHYGEDGLREIENKYLNADLSKVNVFTHERNDVCDKESKTGHTVCFRTIYILAYVSAGIVFLSSIIFLLCF